MQKTKAELYDLIKDIKPKKDFDKEIKTRYKAAGELIDHDTIAYLLVDELGRNTQSITPIGSLTPTGDYTIKGTVQSIAEPKTFRKKNGNQGKVVNIQLSDNTGTCRLVLWNGDIDQIQHKDIHPGTRLKVINGYAKQGYQGTELHLGRWGMLELLEQDTPPEQQPTQDSITGVLTHKEPTRAFFKDNGEFGFVTTITLKQDETETRVTLWDTHVKHIQSISIGETITIQDYSVKQGSGSQEYHLNGNGKISKKNKKKADS